MTTLERVPTRTGTDTCGFCGYRIVTTAAQTSSGIRCCSRHCRDALESGAEPFAGRADFKYFTTGVSVLDSLLPQGVPANSFIILSGAAGIRHRGLQTELLWRRLTRGEPAIVMTYVDPPIAIVEHFLKFGWNVLPYLESGDLQIIDCFTSRLREEHQTPTHQAEWNEHLGAVLDDTVTMVRETGNLESVEDTLHSLLESMDMTGSGIVVIDSLNEVEIQGHESETEQFIKEIRADICSRKFVPIFTSLTSTENDPFTRDYRYLFDGIVEMRKTESYDDTVRLKQLHIRKMDGALYRPHYVTYEIAGPEGFQIYDPEHLLSSVYGIPSNTGYAGQPGASEHWS